MSYMTCLECGGDTHSADTLQDNGMRQTVKVACSHCDAEGVMVTTAGMHPTKTIKEGPFAELTAEGMQTLRDNIGFEPVYENDS